jgi:hypothetical protein
MRDTTHGGLVARGSLLTLVLLLLPAQVIARSDRARSDWSNVTRLSPGRLVSVQPFDGKVMAGELISAGENEIVIHTDGKDVSVPRQNIRVIKRAPRLLGPSVLVALGAAVAQPVVGWWASSHNYNSPAVALPGFVALGGAVVALTQLPRTVYEAPPEATRR